MKEQTNKEIKAYGDPDKKERIDNFKTAINNFKITRELVKKEVYGKYPDGQVPPSEYGKIGSLTRKINRMQGEIVKIFEED